MLNFHLNTISANPRPSTNRISAPPDLPSAHTPSSSLRELPDRLAPQAHPSFSQALFHTSLQLVPLYIQSEIKKTSPAPPPSSLQDEASPDSLNIPPATVDRNPSIQNINASPSSPTLAPLLTKKIVDPLAPSIYAQPFYAEAIPPSTKITTKFLDHYRDWYKNMPNKIKKDDLLFSTHKTQFLSTFGVDADELHQYVRRNGQKKLRGYQLQQKEKGMTFTPITLRLLKQWHRKNHSPSSQATSPLSHFAKTYNIFLNDLEKFCKPKYGLTLRGKQALAVGEGQIFRPLTPTVLQQYLSQPLLAQCTADTPMRTLEAILEAFCRQENLLVEELEHCLAIRGYLPSNSETAIRHLICNRPTLTTLLSPALTPAPPAEKDLIIETAQDLALFSRAQKHSAHPLAISTFHGTKPSDTHYADLHPSQKKTSLERHALPNSIFS